MLSLRKEFEIKKKAEEILNKSEVFKVPVDLNTILVKQNINYYEKDLNELELDPEKNIEALLLSKIVKGKEQNTIILNNNIEEKYPRRKNFTIAHEIGHLILHAQKGEPYIAARKKNNDVLNEEEEEANKFASHLLMPDTLVENIFFELPKISIAILSEKFNVSEKAMSKKLMELGLRINA